VVLPPALYGDSFPWWRRDRDHRHRRRLLGSLPPGGAPARAVT